MVKTKSNLVMDYQVEKRDDLAQPPVNNCDRTLAVRRPQHNMEERYLLLTLLLHPDSQSMGTQILGKDTVVIYRE